MTESGPVREVAAILVIGDEHGTLPQTQAIDQPTVHHADSIPQALRKIQSGATDPVLVILKRCRPGDFSPRQVAQLRRAAPLARIVEWLGPWCDGETRSGEPLPGTIRIPWHRWDAWWLGEWQEQSLGRSPAWFGPVTETDDERWLDSPAYSIDRIDVLAICGSQGSVADWLRDSFAAVGIRTVMLPQAPAIRWSGATAGIWIGMDRDETTWSELKSFVDSIRPSPVAVVCGFPRPDDVERARECGACSLFALPLRMEELLKTIAPASSAVAGTYSHG